MIISKTEAKNEVVSHHFYSLTVFLSHQSSHLLYLLLVAVLFSFYFSSKLVAARGLRIRRSPSFSFHFPRLFLFCLRPPKKLLLVGGSLKIGRAGQLPPLSSQFENTIFVCM
jgi:hypothetical protein